MAKVLTADKKDLGGFYVSRVLPNPEKKMVGPFIFFDHIGPGQFDAGRGINVRPHPHIGLATVTYLFEGSMLHRDSLGYVQEIRPGGVNWMTAGAGIVHSERETVEVRANEHRVHGLQLWVALPPEEEGVEPDFTHVPAIELPCIYHEGVMMRLIVGEAYGSSSPVKTYSPMFYLDVVCEPDNAITHPNSLHEAAVYVISGAVEINGTHFEAGQFVLLEAGDESVRALEHSRFVILGGEKFERAPLLYWNFVAYERATLDAAMKRWDESGFPTIPGDDREFIPLPER
jgi:redox-sensitive bicupin YhaK (pirin superfamily)